MQSVSLIDELLVHINNSVYRNQTYRTAVLLPLADKALRVKFTRARITECSGISVKQVAIINQAFVAAYSPDHKWFSLFICKDAKPLFQWGEKSWFDNWQYPDEAVISRAIDLKEEYPYCLQEAIDLLKSFGVDFLASVYDDTHIETNNGSTVEYPYEANIQTTMLNGEEWMVDTLNTLFCTGSANVIRFFRK